eukprot:9115-Heterococcus_DN1.PRE.4
MQCSAAACKFATVHLNLLLALVPVQFHHCVEVLVELQQSYSSNTVREVVSVAVRNKILASALFNYDEAICCTVIEQIDCSIPPGSAVIDRCAAPVTAAA